jgi:hypothetical protein
MPAIPATQEIEIRRSWFKACLGKNSITLSEKKQSKKKKD